MKNFKLTFSLWKELMSFDGTVPGWYFCDCYQDFWDYLNYSYTIDQVRNRNYE